MDRPNPRPKGVIFADLVALAQSEGALHELSAIVYRDWVIGYDPKDGSITNSPEDRWSTDKLNKNELMLLLGLLVQVPDDRSYRVVVPENDFIKRADVLLREFHDCVLLEALPVFNPVTQQFANEEALVGPLAREAIYYGAESFYQHQLVKFSRLRYRDDETWLLQNIGITIRPILDMARFIANHINQQMSAVGFLQKKGKVFTHGELTNSLLISKEMLRNKYGKRADAFIAKFSTPVSNSNKTFVDPFAVNQVSIAPLIDLGDVLYVSSQYLLFESIYESPFYWMFADAAYRATHSKNRGVFLEKTTAHILRSVFGEKHVFQNVSIMNGKTQAGEVDVLVVYGEFVLIVQAKSKRITLKARAGDTEALRTDFDGAIQSPYNQALSCAALVKNQAECISSDGRILKLPRLPRVFPVVALSDPFPASTLLSRGLLARPDNVAPVIWDIGVFDCVARILPSPIEMLFYLQSRASVFDSITSDSEYNFLGYHLSSKLVLPSEADFMMLDRDFATAVDDFMIAADVSIKVERPRGVLERLSIPFVSELLAELKNADPRLSSVVIDLYNFSSAGLLNLSSMIADLREEIIATGKAIKSFTIKTASGGITYAVTGRFDDEVKESAEIIGRKHKYDTKSDRWYVILDNVKTRNAIDGLLPIVFPWSEDQTEAESSVRAASFFNSRKVEFMPGPISKLMTGRIGPISD